MKHFAKKFAFVVACILAPFFLVAVTVSVMTGMFAMGLVVLRLCVHAMQWAGILL